MPKISRILMPVDFSERCLGMTHYARAIAAKYDAEIILLHVVNPVLVAPDVGMGPAAMITTPKWLIDEKAKLLEQFATKELEGVRVTRLVYEGIPEAQIVDMAQTDEIQLVIMPTHGYGTFRRFLIGSVTAKVLDDLAGPVLTGVHMERHAHDLQEEFKSVACAIDLEQSSAETLLTAASFAHDFGAKLAVVHVRPSTGPGSSATTADLKPQLEELVEAELTKHQLHFEPGRFMVCVQTGEISRTICDFAERQGAGLLVIGREHKGQQGGRLQTHTYSIIRQSACPVLSV